MNIALDHLGDLPLFWINLDQSGVRRQHMVENVVPLFMVNRRISAVYADEVTEDTAKQFVQQWHEYWRENHGSLTIANKPPGHQFRMQTQRTNIAIRRSHRKALFHGLVEKWERFMVAEDDIMPRNTLLDGDVPLPPADADVAIWSGGLPMAGVTADSDLFVKGREHQWVQVRGRDSFNALGAGAYEVTREAAEMIYGETVGVPMSWDHAWGVPFSHLKVYRLRPNAFAQVGPSIRNGRDRQPVTNRKAES